MPTTPAISPILELEPALQDAWRRRDRVAATEIKARLGRLWEQRRAELAELSKRTPSRWDGVAISVRRQA
jgi:hypothetical protein